MHVTYKLCVAVSNSAKIRNRHNQVPHLTQDTIGKVTNSQLDTTNESQEVSPFPAGDHKARLNRRSQLTCLSYQIFHVNFNIMALQMLFDFERFSTSSTNIRPLSGMYSHVSPHVPKAHTSPTTQITYVSKAWVILIFCPQFFI